MYIVPSGKQNTEFSHAAKEPVYDRDVSCELTSDV